MNKAEKLGVILLNSLKNEIEIVDSIKSFIVLNQQMFFLNLSPEFSLENIQEIYPEIIYYETVALNQLFLKIKNSNYLEKFLIADTRYQLEYFEEIFTDKNSEVQLVRLSSKRKTKINDLSINKFEQIPLNFGFSEVIYRPLFVRRDCLEKFSGSDFNDLSFEKTENQVLSGFSLKAQNNYFASRVNTPFSLKIASLNKKISEFDYKKLRNISAQIVFYKNNKTNISTQNLADLKDQFSLLYLKKTEIVEEINKINDYLLNSEKKEFSNCQLELYFFSSLGFLFGDYPDNQEIKELINKLSKIYPESLTLLFNVFVLNYNLNNFISSKKIIFLLLSLSEKKIFLKGENILPDIFTEKDFYYFLLAINSYKEGDYHYCRLYSEKIENKLNYRDALNSLKIWTDSQIINLPTLEKVYQQNKIRKNKIAFILLRIAREHFLECNIQKSFYFYQLALESAVKEKNQDILITIYTDLLKNAKLFLIKPELKKNLLTGTENDFWASGWNNFQVGNFFQAYEDFNSYLKKLEIKNKIGEETVDQINKKQTISLIIKLREIISDFRKNEHLYQNIFQEIAISAKEINFRLNESKYKFCQIYTGLQKIRNSKLKSYLYYLLNEYLSLICLLQNQQKEAKSYAKKALKFLPESVFLQKVAEILPEDEYEKVIKKVFFRYHTLQYKDEFHHFLREFDRLKAKKIIEIGTYEGGSLLAMAHFLESESELISIDTIPEEKMESLKMEIKALDKNLKTFFVTGDSHSKEILKEVEKILKGKKVDLLFIDGDHTYEGVKSDFELYSPLVNKKGVIALHDIQKYPSQYVFQVDRLWKKLALKYQVKKIIYNEQSPGIGLIYVNSLKKIKKYSFSDLLIKEEEKNNWKKIIAKFDESLSDLGIGTKVSGKKILKNFNNLIFANFTNNRLNNYLKSFTYIIFLVDDFNSSEQELKILLENASGVLINGEKIKKKLAEINFSEYLELNPNFLCTKIEGRKKKIKEILEKMTAF